MAYQSWPADFDELFRCLQAMIRFEIRAAAVRQPTETVRVIPPYPHGAPPLYHKSDEDCVWEQEQPAWNDQRN